MLIERWKTLCLPDLSLHRCKVISRDEFQVSYSKDWFKKFSNRCDSMWTLAARGGVTSAPRALVALGSLEGFGLCPDQREGEG